MHPLIQLKKATPLLLTIFALGWLALSDRAQAVSPPPDGGYVGFTTAEGTNALKNLTTGAGNTAVGWSSLLNVTTGNLNTGVGAGTLVSNNGDSNTAIGAVALLSNTTGTQNTANGAAALLFNDSGLFNTAVGTDALYSNTTGSANTAIGNETLLNNTTGNFNIALGASAGLDLTTGNSNIDIDSSGVAGESNTIRIGFVQTSTFIAGIRGVTTRNNNAIPVLIDTNGQLGTISSSRRFKKDIQLMDKASETLLALKPVTFHYKSDKTKRREFGLIAEQVAEANPDLVVRNENGEIYTVRYDAVNAMLLNEFLKEHKMVEQQQKTIAALNSTVAEQQKTFESKLAEEQKQIEALTAAVQKVSAQLELSKPVRQTVLNSQ